MVSSVNRETQSANNPVERGLSLSFSMNWEVAVYIVIFLLAIFTRFYLLGERVMSHDESLHTRFSYNLYADGDFAHTPLMHGPILFHATAFSYFLFGDNDFTSRIYTAVLGVMLVMSPLLFRRWLGRWGAIFASVMLLISPLMLYYNRYIRHDTPSILSAVLMMYAVLMYINGPAHLQRKPYWLYLLAVGMIWNLGSKETAFIYIAIFGIFLAIFWFVQLAEHYFKVRGKTIFEFLMMGVLFGGVLSLGMYIILDIIKFEMFPYPGEVAFFDLPASEQGIFFLWTILATISVLAVVFGTLFWSYRDKIQAIRWRDVAIVLLVGFVSCSALVVIEERSHLEARSESEPAAPAVPDGENLDTGETVVISDISWMPIVLVYIGAALAVAFVFLAKRQGWWEVWASFPVFDILIVMGALILPWSTAFVPFIMHPSAADHVNIAQSLPGFLYNTLLNIPGVGTPEQLGNVLLHFYVWLPLMALAIFAGIAWNWRVFMVAFTIFHVIFAFFFTTVFTNMAGLATGMVYSLGYWLEQQGVRRGSQPQYYYLLIIMPFYEFLPVIGSVLAMIAGGVVFWKKRRRDQELDEAEAQAILDEVENPADYVFDENMPATAESQAAEQTSEDKPKPKRKRSEVPERYKLIHVPFLLLFSWLAILNLVGYSLAGEKMPWLGTHLTMPMIFLTAWYLGRIVDKLDWAKLRENGWLYFLLLPLMIVAFLQIMGPFFIGNPPFAGLMQMQLAETFSWLAAIGVFVGVGFAVMRVIEITSWTHFRRMFAVVGFLFLGVITFRSAWIASFINYDYPTEFLVYAHAAPAIKDPVLDKIEELSLRTTDGLDLRFAYDNEVSWPYSWYFRNFTDAVFVGSNPTVQNLDDTVIVVVGDGNRNKVEPILEDRYQHFEHMRLWWPMQDYFNLTSDRVLNALDFSAGNPTAAQIRKGMFDIWWNRDYSTYGEATGKNFDITSWPVSDRMHFYVRKDFASQIWEYGIGDGADFVTLDDLETVNACTANWQDKEAVTVFQTPPQPMQRPLDMEISSDELLYVAEEYGHRISVFDLDGNYIRSFGQQGGRDEAGMVLNRPNGVAISVDDELLVADTWNYRALLLNEEDQPLTRWGQPGEFGFGAATEPTDGFWGPRDIDIDDEGRIYIADTGNKRIRVYELNGMAVDYLFDIGEGGSALGELDEPSSMAVHSDGRVFIADTWNRRVSVFNRNGEFLYQIPVRGWYEELGNRPYLAIDENRDLLYVTDPDSGRVLVYNTAGDCLGSFGEYNSQPFDTSQINVVGGIAVDAEGFVYVSDAGTNTARILKYTPFEPPVTLQSESEPVDPLAERTEEELLPETTAEDIGGIDQELLPETTVEVELTESVELAE